MPFHDFRQFLDVMRQQGELVDINQPIALTDVGKALKHAYAKGRKATSFNKNGTDFPLVCGVYSSRKHALMAFEADEKNITQKVLDGLNNPIKPKMTNGGAPCHEVVITDDIDIRRFPIPTYSPEGRRPLHHARHRGVEGPGDRRAGHRALPLPHPRQGHVLVLGAAVPPLRQEPDQVPADGRDAEGGADHRRRSDPRLYLPGAGAGPDQRLGGRRRPARRAGRADQVQDLRHRGAGAPPRW